MTYRRSYNLRGMDISSPYNTDRLWYLQDSVSIGPNAIRTRPRFPAQDPGFSGPHYTAQTSRNNAGAFGGPDNKLRVFNPGSSSFVPEISNEFPYYSAGSLCAVVPYPVDSCRVADDTFFVIRSDEQSNEAAHLVRWSGGTANQIQSSSAGTAGASRTASVTSGSASVVFSGDIAASIVGSKINFTASRDHFYTIDSYNSITNTATLTRPATFTSGATNFTIHGWSFLTTNNALENASTNNARGLMTGGATYATTPIWDTSSGGEPAGLVYAWSAEGHQGRLFVSNGNEIRYSGTEEDVTTRHGGVEYWDVDSRFVVAPELGTRVEKMVSFNNDLIIFKDKGICVLRGTVANGDPSRLGARVDTISTHLRCSSPRHAISTNLGVVLISTQGMYLVSGEGIERIGQEVWPRFSVEIEPSSNVVMDCSLFMDDKLYLMYRWLPAGSGPPLENPSARACYACWDTLTGEWSFRTFNELLAPGASADVQVSGETITVGFPASDSGDKFICFQNGEGFGSVEDGAQLIGVGDAFLSHDNPEFVAVTAPFTSEDPGITHIRTRIAYTNCVASGASNLFVINNFGADYGFDVESIITDGNSPTHEIGGSDAQWMRHTIANDPYGWAKSLAIYSVWDGGANTVHLQGLAVSYDESGAIP